MRALVVLLMLATPALGASSEHVRDIRGLWMRIEGCLNQKHLWFLDCANRKQDEPLYSEAQVLNAIDVCAREQLDKFFECSTLYPKPTLTEEIEAEIE